MLTLRAFVANYPTCMMRSHLYSSVVGKNQGRVPTLDEFYLQTPVQ